MPARLFSRPSSYAARALAYLAGRPQGQMIARHEIAANESIPAAFLGKVLNPLCRDRFLRSRKGLGGGYELLVPPARISLLDIVRSVEGEPFMDCLLEDRPCSCAAPCEVHDSWNEMRNQLRNYLQRVTVADLADQRQSRQSQMECETAKETGQERPREA